LKRFDGNVKDWVWLEVAMRMTKVLKNGRQNVTYATRSVCDTSIDEI